MLVVDQLKRGDPRLRWLAIGVLLGMFVLTTGLWFLQVVNNKKYEKNLISQSYRSVRLPAVRGRILDRNGVILAESRPSYNVNLYLEELRPNFTEQYYVLKSNAVYRIALENKALPKEQRKRYTTALRYELEAQARYLVVRNLMNRISRVLQVPLELSEKDFRKHYDEKRSLPLPVAENLSPSQVARFAEGASTLPGVDLQVQSLRSYPLGQTAAHLLGYMTRTERAPGEEDEIEFDYRLPDFRGAVGVEGTFDEQLRGVAGAKTLLVNNMQYRQTENVWLPPKPGEDLILTIDSQIQQAAEKSLKAQGFGIRGAVVVMDVRNGDVLAMASAPSFDPNAFVPSISHDEYASFNDVETKPMLNRASFGIYQPGSSFKIVIALAGLESGKLKPHEQFYSKGFYTLSGHRWDCTAGAGMFDFHRAFIKSCNCYFIEHGLDVGLDGILRMGHQFCLGEKTELPTRQDLGGYFPDIGTHRRNAGGPWSLGDTANLSIGQGDIAVTPLQMTVLSAAVANGGKVFWPRLVERLESEENGLRKVTESFEPARLRNEIKWNPANLRLVQEAMRDDVADSEGTGKQAAVAGWQVCGKTGTAVVNRRGTEANRITWFVSYAPFDAPRYAVVAMVENGSSGGGACAPIARRVYEALQKMEQNAQMAPPNLALRN
jgi:penicillin-binding protein 2